MLTCVYFNALITFDLQTFSSVVHSHECVRPISLVMESSLEHMTTLASRVDRDGNGLLHFGGDMIFLMRNVVLRCGDSGIQAMAAEVRASVRARVWCTDTELNWSALMRLHGDSCLPSEGRAQVTHKMMVTFELESPPLVADCDSDVFLGQVEYLHAKQSLGLVSADRMRRDAALIAKLLSQVRLTDWRARMQPLHFFNSHATVCSYWFCFCCALAARRL